jgi:hypothetical protein
MSFSYAQQLRHQHLVVVEANEEPHKKLIKRRYREIMDKLAAEHRAQGWFYIKFADYPDFFVDLVVDLYALGQLLRDDDFKYRSPEQTESMEFYHTYNAYVINLCVNPPTYSPRLI